MKKNEHSFAFGAYTTLDLLKKKKDSVRIVLFKEEGLEDSEVKKVLEFCKKENVSFEINSRLIEKISFKENTYIVGVFKKFSCSIDSEENHVVLVNPTSTGNFGTIIRTMLSFNFKNLAIIKPAVDIFHPKTIRSSMGSFFHINFEYFNSFEEYLDKYSKRKIYSFMLEGESSLNDVFFEKKELLSLVFGNESNGLSEDFKNFGHTIYIPQSNETDSLNLSVSVGIALYKASMCG